jgi:limonene 1,2-monooxygenase
MKFGMFMMPSHPPGENPTLAFERDLQLIEHAERLGFDEVLIGEHHSGGWETVPAPDLMIAAAAQRTHRISLGTAVINLPYHHPFEVAERMAFLDHLTNGRLIFGVGPGALPTDFILHGLNPELLRPMMNESLEIITKLLESDTPITHEGQFWQIRDMFLQVKPLQRPLPLAIACGISGNSVEQCGKYGMIPMSASIFSPAGADMLCRQWAAIQESADRHGTVVRRDTWRIAQPVYVAETTEEAMADIDRGATREYHEYFFTLGLKGLFEEYPGQPVEEITVDQLKRKMGWLVGDPDTVTRQIRELHEGTGGFGGILFITNDWADQGKWMKSMELFARYVMPQLRGTVDSLNSSWHSLEERARVWRQAIEAAGGLQNVVRDNLPKFGQDSIGRVAPEQQAAASPHKGDV